MWLNCPVDLFTQPDAHGDEHEVWFAGEFVVKLAYPNFFGLRVVYRSDESQQCNPCEYFERWVLHNEFFGDDVDILGAFDTVDGIRVVLIQRAIKGNPASIQEIEAFFRGNGWLHFRVENDSAWFDEDRRLVVSDILRFALVHGAVELEKVDGAAIKFLGQLAIRGKENSDGGAGLRHLLNYLFPPDDEHGVPRFQGEAGVCDQQGGAGLFGGLANGIEII